MLGNLCLAENIFPQDQNNFVLSNPGIVYTALSYPAFISFDALLTISGIEEEQSFTLEVVIEDSDRKEIASIFENKNDVPSQNSSDEILTMNGVLNLKKIAVQKQGVYDIVVKTDGKELTRAKFKASLAN